MQSNMTSPGPPDPQVLSEVNASLRQRAEELEQALAETRAQREQYKELFRMLMTSQLTVEDLKRFAEDDDETGCLTLDEFIHELEAIVSAKGD